MKTAETTLGLIGGTPIVRLKETPTGRAKEILVKLERLNPTGSVKDRIALAMVEAAEREGKLRPGGVIIEPTSGNTGIGLAMVGAVKGYRVMLTMPESMSIERRKLLSALGAEVVLTPGASGMRGAIERADRLAEEVPGAFIPGQFDNPANPRVHEETTGPEIWASTDGGVDIVVAGIGTGGTITGVSRHLKARKPSIHSVGVEPAESPVITEGLTGPHKIQGIGAGFIPGVLDLRLVDEMQAIASEEAAVWMRHLARKEGIFGGISSGAALAAAVRIAETPVAEGRVIVTILPDGGEKYLAGALWEEPSASTEEGIGDA